ncbi:hypothetical protein [Porphyromonas macacae]|nr:hypothetical protein [Porphyromonas macacae]
MTDCIEFFFMRFICGTIEFLARVVLRVAGQEIPEGTKRGQKVLPDG